MVKKLESAIVREICDWLNERGFFFWRQNNIPVFQKDRFGARYRALPKYTPKGLPDIIILSKGRLIGLEVKVPTYWKRTDAQIEMKDKFLNNGGEYYLVTSLEEAQEAMRRHLWIDAVK